MSFAHGRGQSWVIEAADDGLVNVLRRGRTVRRGVPVEVAIRYVREHRADGDKVFREAPDGYRTNITRRV